MNSALNQLLQTFDCVTQPVFYARDRRILYTNAAAMQLMILPETPLTALCGETDVPQTDAQQLCLHLAGRDYQTFRRPLEGGSLYLVQRPLDEQQNTVQLQTLSSVARTLRMPLTNLFGAVNAIFPQLEELEDPNLQRQMSGINRALYQLMHLSCNLGDFTAAQGGQMRLYTEKTELCAFMDALCERTQPLCQTLGVALRCELPQKTIHAMIDRQKVERCILNLISNALRHHANEPEQLTLRLHCSGPLALIQLLCSRNGFTDAELSDAFCRYETDAPLPQPDWGAGFGLPLVQHIVRLHGGTLMLCSPESGGSIAVFSLPLAQKQPTVNSPVAAMDYAGGFRHELVELADVLPLEVFESENIN